MPLTITDPGVADRQFVLVAGESRYYNAATANTTSALFYEAETLTELGTTTTTAGASGASGSGSNVQRNTDLTAVYQALLKSEIDATNAALTHKGTFNVWVRTYRPTGNTGAVSIRLEWAEGDYLRTTLNDPVSYAADEREGVFNWAKLGLVSIDPKSTRWEFRLLAKSTVAGDEIDVDCFVLAPTEVIYMELSGKPQFQNPTAFSALSTMDTESGAITGDTATAGGVWAGAGDVTDLSVAAGVATRSEVSDAADTGRYVVSGVAGFAAQVVQADVKLTASTGNGQLRLGVLGRYTDTNNWVMASIGTDSFTWSGYAATAPFIYNILIRKRVAGTVSSLTPLVTFTGALGTFYSLRLHIDAAGRWFFWCWPTGTNAPSAPLLRGQDAALATGGTLASGKPGIYDEYTGSNTPNTRTYDNFLSFAPVADAAIFNGQSLELRSDRAVREDSTGAFFSPVSNRAGRYLKVPPGGPEGRSTRLVVLALRNDPYTMGDVAAIDDISAQLRITPRGLVIPEA